MVIQSWIIIAVLIKSCYEYYEDACYIILFLMFLM